MRPSLSTRDVADRLGTTDEHVRKLARERRIPHYKIGGIYKFDPDEIVRWLEQAHVAGDPEPAT